MGTSLGNLQVLNATQEQVSALMPGAAVGRWSERFVTVLDDTFGLGSVDSPARALSKQLPQAAVLSVGLADSDLLELVVWQGGKRLTVRAHLPYDGVSKRGDPRKFCQALGLPPEDEKRLKAVWAKGDAEEQLELTAALVGAPLWSGTDALPRGEEVRDAARVDRWLAQRPDPPKVKNRTRAQVIQELNLSRKRVPLCPDVCRENHVSGEINAKKKFIFFPPSCGDDEEQGLRGQLWQAGPDGTLTCQVQSGLNARWVYEADGARVLAFDRDYDVESEWALVFDSEGVLPVPLSLDRIDGFLSTFCSMPDGGLVEWEPGKHTVPGPENRPVQYFPGEIHRVRPDGTLETAALPEHYDSVAAAAGKTAYLGRHIIGPGFGGRGVSRFTCYRVDGTRIAEKDFPWNTELRHWDEDGLWLTAPLYDERADQYDLIRTMLTMEELGRVRMPGLGLSKTVWNAGRSLALHAGFGEGLWLLDGKDLSVRAAITDRRKYMAPMADGFGRFWVQVGGSTMEAYDQDLNLLSRHRLKGEVFSRYLDGQGRLCAVTYSECREKYIIAYDSEGKLHSYYNDKNKEIVRVYRLA